MRSSFEVIFSIFSILAGFISPLITVLFGVLLTRAEALLQTFNLFQKGDEFQVNQYKTIRLIRLIGLLMIIAGALRLMDKVVNLFRFLL